MLEEHYRDQSLPIEATRFVLQEIKSSDWGWEDVHEFESTTPATIHMETLNSKNSNPRRIIKRYYHQIRKA